MDRDRRDTCKFKTLLFAVALFLSGLAVGQAQTNYQRLKSFGPLSGGANPFSRLLEGSDGLLYGTTYSGGTNNQGTVFHLRKDGSDYRVLLNLTTGLFPVGGLTEGTNGALYGTTSSGGAHNYGIIFKVNMDGSGFSLLHEFDSSVADGGIPFGDLVNGLDGTLYGTTSQGGISNLGTLFRLNLNGGGYTNLHHFTGPGSGDGSNPYAGLVRGSEGMLYGNTQTGGSNNFGTVFALNPNGEGYSVLHHFAGATFNDGRQPIGSLILGSDNVLYGTTYYGGTNDLGAIFKLNTNGSSYSVLLSFAAGTNGYQPWGGLAEGTNGILLGTTRRGGTNDVGTVFRMNKDGSGYLNLHRFQTDNGDGTSPQAALLLPASDGAVYGVTPFGGNSTYGTVFRLFSTPRISITSISKDETGVLLNLAGGGAGQSYNLLATTNITIPEGWQVIGSSVAGIDGTFQFLDATATNWPTRFYRSATP